MAKVPSWKKRVPSLLNRTSSSALFSWIATQAVRGYLVATYALGHVARRYYAGGRTMNTQMLKDSFSQMVGQARGLQAQYQPQIEQQARTRPAEWLWHHRRFDKSLYE